MLRSMQVHELPEAQRAKLQENEKPYHFSFISSKGGCATASPASQWILVTDKRVLFEASVVEVSAASPGYVHQAGSIPIAKVSYVATATTNRGGGCAQVKVTRLRINSSGGAIDIAIPTQEEAERVRSVIEELLSGDRSV